MCRGEAMTIGVNPPVSMANETDALDRLRRRDSAEFVRFVRANEARIARLLGRLVGSEDPVDAVQQVFLSAYEGLPHFRGDCRLYTWLTRIAINEGRKRRRRQMLESAVLRSFRWLAAPTRDTGNANPGSMETREECASIRRAIDELPHRYREVVVLRYLEDMEIDDMATALGATRNGIEVRLTRAREKLRSRLKGIWEART